MFRIKYLLGAFTGIFGLLYMAFGIIGWDDALTASDKYMSFAIGGIFIVGALFLLRGSYVDRKNEKLRVNEAITALMLIHPTVSAEILASEVNISAEDAQEYLSRYSQSAVSSL